MSAAGEAKAKEDALASGAKPRLEERVRKQGRRPPSELVGIVEAGMVAARRRAIEQRPTNGLHTVAKSYGGRE